MASAFLHRQQDLAPVAGVRYERATPVAGIPISDITDRRPLYRARPADGALIGNLLMLDDGANANYNGLLLSLQHRFNHGFTLLSNYNLVRTGPPTETRSATFARGYYQIQNNRNAELRQLQLRCDPDFSTRRLST